MRMKWADRGAGREAPDLKIEGMATAPRAGAANAAERDGEVAHVGVILARRRLLFLLGEGREGNLLHESVVALGRDPLQAMAIPVRHSLLSLRGSPKGG